jgi:hypothetical protein
MLKISGRVIIDPEALTKAHPILSALFSLVKGGQKMVWETADKKRSPAVIPAFSLDEDQWVIVAVKGLENPKWLDNWQSLKYSKNDKPKFDRLKTLVQGHKAFLDKQNPDSGKTGDFIPEKGNALVILLSGPSGLGKTLTAGTASSTEWEHSRARVVLITAYRMPRKCYRKATVQNQSREVLWHPWQPQYKYGSTDRENICKR